MNISLKNDMTFDSFLYFLGLLQLRFQKIRRRWPCPKNMCPHYLVCPMLSIVRPMSVSTKAAKYDCGNGLDQSKKKLPSPLRNLNDCYRFVNISENVSYYMANSKVGFRVQY